MIEYIESLESMRTLADKWSETEKHLGSPMLSYEWFLSGAISFCPPYDLRIAVRKDGSSLDGIAPLGLRKDLIRKVEVLGTTFLTEKDGFLFENTEALSELVDSVIKFGKPIFLRRLGIHSDEAKAWETAIRDKRLRSLVREERLPRTVVKSKWDEFEKQISSSRRSSFRRLQRLVESKGEVTFQVVAPTPENLDQYLDEAFEVEATSWRTRKGTAMKYDKKLGTFFREYAGRTTALHEFYLFFLRVDEKPIAVELAVIHANRLWILKIGHDESWSWCSPGILLMHQIVKYCFDEGLEACEFGGTDEPWLHIWSNDSESAWTYRIYPRTVKGLFQLWADVLTLAASKVTNMMSTGKSKRGRATNAKSR